MKRGVIAACNLSFPEGPLKKNAWKIYFLLDMAPFQGAHSLVLGRCNWTIRLVIVSLCPNGRGLCGPLSSRGIDSSTQ